MRMVLRAVDRKHGRALPAGRKIARALRLIFSRQRREVLAHYRSGRTSPPDLSRWTMPMVEALEPLLRRYYQDGIRDAVRRLRRLVLRTALGTRRKDEGGPDFGRILDVFAPDFSVFNPRVLEAIRQAVFNFADSTNRTSTVALAKIGPSLREALATGLEQGESLAFITARVQEIFDDPARAQMIAASEASRAVHAGQLLAARESGVVQGKRWLASSDACDLCLPLDGKEVGLDEDFAVDARGGPYARVPYPPRHPHC
jgi:F like protein